MTGRGHQLLHSDAFAAELEALGFDSSLFGAAGVPAPVFQALVPRRAGVFDENANTFGTGDEPATFSRTSDDAIYLDADGTYQKAAAGVIRPEYSSAGVFLGYLFEPAITNKCTNYNANPDAGLTNLALVGDPAATLTRVDDSAELAAAGLANICTSGFALKLDNSGGASHASCNVAGATGNTNTHSLSVWCRGSGGVKLKFGGSDYGTTALTTGYARISQIGKTPTDALQTLQIRANAGAIVFFVLNQLEQSAIISSPIITQGATGSRSIDALSWANRPAGMDLTKGLLAADVYLPWDSSAVPASTVCGIVGIRSAAHSSLLRLSANSAGGGSNLWVAENSGGTNANHNLGASPNLYRLIVRWDAGNDLQVGGYSNNAGAWGWGTARTFVAWDDDDVLRFCYGVDFPCYLKNVRLWNRTFTAAEVQRLFTP